jgi:hypothetical protein
MVAPGTDLAATYGDDQGVAVSRGLCLWAAAVGDTGSFAQSPGSNTRNTFSKKSSENNQTILI